jgi:hypothetical protein
MINSLDIIHRRNCTWEDVLETKFHFGNVSYKTTMMDNVLKIDCSNTELHKIPARVQCTVQCADWIDEPAPPTIP